RDRTAISASNSLTHLVDRVCGGPVSLVVVLAAELVIPHPGHVGNRCVDLGFGPHVVGHRGPPLEQSCDGTAPPVMPLGIAEASWTPQLSASSRAVQQCGQSALPAAMSRSAIRRRWHG